MAALVGIHLDPRLALFGIVEPASGEHPSDRGGDVEVSLDRGDAIVVDRSEPGGSNLLLLRRDDGGRGCAEHRGGHRGEDDPDLFDRASLALDLRRVARMLECRDQGVGDIAQSERLLAR